MNRDSKELDFLYARIDDMIADAQGGILRVSDFMSEAEIYRVSSYLRARKVRYFVYGGYEGAVRCRVYFLPDFIDAEPGCDIPCVLADYGYEDETVCLKISGSGFRDLSHRDFMGSVLSLGVERRVVGDIVIYDSHTAYVFLDRTISAFVNENLKKVSRDGVKITFEGFGDGWTPEHKYEEIRDTVASLRIDSVVAAATRLSRENAKKTVESGLCEINYEICQKAERELCEGDVFSVRGYGKYKLGSIGSVNQRGRTRIEILKYV